MSALTPSHTAPGLALLGAGIFAKEAHLPAIAALGSAASLRAVYSRSHKSAVDLAVAAKASLNLENPPDIYSDEHSDNNLDALLKRPDIAAVLVVLPISVQPEIVIKALAAGKHVLSEKPIAPDVKGGIALIRAYEEKYKAKGLLGKPGTVPEILECAGYGTCIPYKGIGFHNTGCRAGPKGLIWRVAENYELEPGYQKAAKAIRDGKIGDVRFFRLSAVGYVDKDSKWYKTPWRTIPDYQGGFLLDGGVHSAALLRILVPQPFRSVTSYASLSREHLPPQDTITALISCSPADATPVDPKPIDKPAHGIFELSFASPAPSRAGVGNTTIVTGTKGWLQLSNEKVVAEDGTERSVIRVTIHKVTHPQEKEGDVLKEEKEVIDEPPKGVEEEVASFVRAIQGKDDGFGEPLGALRDVAIIQASLNSEGKVVDLDKLLKDG